MWELDLGRDAALIGAVTGVVLFAAHYALDHWRAAFLAYPPRAYSVGVGLLFGGYAGWAALHPAPLPPLVTVAALGVVTALAGAGTWTAHALHGWQHRRAQAATRRV